MLSEFSTFGISNNTGRWRYGVFQVVNCFQNLVPLVSATTVFEGLPGDDGCELLSEFSTFGISNNQRSRILQTGEVVNCFQNLVPLVSATTSMLINIGNLTVVNCFQNLVPLVSATTPYCLCPVSVLVVNCFQNLVPLVSATTKTPVLTSTFSL